jgi:hypothetical protein
LTPWWSWLVGGGCGDAAEVSVFESVGVALEGDDLGVVDEAVDHGCGDNVVAVLAEQHDEWAEGRRYLGLDVLARAQAVDNTIEEEVSEPELQALTA